MDLLRIKSLIDVMAGSDLAELQLAHQGWTLTLRRHGGRTLPGQALQSPAPLDERSPHAAPLAAPLAPVAESLPAAAPRSLQAPLFGVLHWQPSPDEPAFVSPGQAVQAGQTLCVIEAMKVFNTIVAEHDGVVDALLAASGDEVDAGQPLLRFR